MINFLFKGYLAAMAIKLLDNYRHLSIQFLKIETAKSYLHSVRMVRLLTVHLVQMGFLIGLIGLGVMLFHIGLFLLLPCSLTTKAILGLFLGLSYMIIGIVALRIFMNEKTWMENSGATALLKDATGPSATD